VKLKISHRATAIPPSETLALAARAKALRAEGRNIIDFSVGEPDFTTPLPALRAAQAAIDARDTKYPPNNGTPELRNAVARRIQLDFGRKVDPARVIVSNGAKQSLFNLVQVLVDPGDEVAFAAPYWVSYPAMVSLAGGTPKPIPTVATEDFRLHPKAVEKALTEKVRVLILNSPQNPTGAVYPPEDVDAIVQICLDRGVAIVSDEMYSFLVFGGARHRSVLESHDPRVEDGVIFVSGVSKTYAMTGFRIGYAYGPKDVIDACSRFQSHSTSGASGISQRAAASALVECDDEAAKMRDAFAERCQVAKARLRSIPDVRVPDAKGAFYVFPDFSAYFGKKIEGELVKGSADLSRVLLDKANVACVPGAAFGAEGHLRISYALDRKDLEEGVSRIARVLASARA
jgi:aspartate/methionine/tyrosine aminotransferase